MLIGIDPKTVTLADLEVLEAPKTIAPVPPAPAERALPPISKRDLRQQFVGVIRMINHLTGGDMREQVDSLDFLVRRNDALEEQIRQLEAEKASYRKALSAVGTVLDLYSGDPFELKVMSKWNKAELGNWMIAAAESIKWVMQRAENALDPDHAVPIAKDPEV